MLRIQRALLGELLVVFLLISFVVTATVFGGFSIRFITHGGEALGETLMTTLLPNLIPVALAYSLPFAWLAAVALVVGRWVSDHEITALSSSGVHLRTLVVPVLCLGVLIGIAGMLFNSKVVAAAHREVRVSVKKLAPQFLNSLKGADRSIAMKGGRLSWDRFDPERRVFIGAMIDLRDVEGDLERQALVKELSLDLVLQSDEQDDLEMLLHEAWIIMAPSGAPEVRDGSESPFPVGAVEEVGATTQFNQLFKAGRILYRPKDMVLDELVYVDAREGVARGSSLKARISLHERLSLGASPFFLGFFALAMALILPPSGRRVRDFMCCFGPAVLIFFPFLLAGPSVAQKQEIPVVLAMWGSNIILGLAACGLLLWGGRR